MTSRQQGGGVELIPSDVPCIALEWKGFSPVENAGASSLFILGAALGSPQVNGGGLRAKVWYSGAIVSAKSSPA